MLWFLDMRTQNISGGIISVINCEKSLNVLILIATNPLALIEEQYFQKRCI